VFLGLGGLGLVGAGCGKSNSNDEKPPQLPTGTAVLLPGSRHAEIQQFGANAFTNYYDASGIRARIRLGTKVLVDCLATGPKAAAPSTEGRWYHLQGPDPYTGLYAAANTFKNGDVRGVPLDQQNPVDPNVPKCPNP
jgi:hypothetical protein